MWRSLAFTNLKVNPWKKKALEEKKFAFGTVMGECLDDFGTACLGWVVETQILAGWHIAPKGTVLELLGICLMLLVVFMAMKLSFIGPALALIVPLLSCSSIRNKPHSGETVLVREIIAIGEGKVFDGMGKTYEWVGPGDCSQREGTILHRSWVLVRSPSTKSY